jgi:uncharacterized protein (TIRG00374 family)
MNRNIQKVLKIAVSLTLIVWMLLKADTNALKQVLREANYVFAFGVFASIAIMNLTQVVRWNILLRSRNAGVKFPKLLKFHMISIFFQSFLPSSFSVDVVKGFLLSKITDSGKAYGSVAFARFIGMIVLFVFMAIVLLVKPELVLGQLFSRELVVALILIFAMSLVIFSKKVSRFIFGRFPKLSSTRFFLRAKAFREDVYVYRKQPSTLVLTVIFSAVIHLCSIFSAYFAFRAINASVPFAVLLVIIPIMYAALLLPVSINGIGAREGILLFLLAPWGVNLEIILASSLITYVAIYSLCLSGGVVYFFSNVKGEQSVKKEKN